MCTPHPPTSLPFRISPFTLHGTLKCSQMLDIKQSAKYRLTLCYKYSLLSFKKWSKCRSETKQEYISEFCLHVVMYNRSSNWGKVRWQMTYSHFQFMWRGNGPRYFDTIFICRVECIIYSTVKLNLNQYLYRARFVVLPCFVLKHHPKVDLLRIIITVSLHALPSWKLNCCYFLLTLLISFDATYHVTVQLLRLGV